MRTFGLTEMAKEQWIYKFVDRTGRLFLNAGRYHLLHVFETVSNISVCNFHAKNNTSLVSPFVHFQMTSLETLDRIDKKTKNLFRHIGIKTTHDALRLDAVPFPGKNELGWIFSDDIPFTVLYGYFDSPDFFREIAYSWNMRLWSTATNSKQTSLTLEKSRTPHIIIEMSRIGYTITTARQMCTIWI